MSASVSEVVTGPVAERGEEGPLVFRVRLLSRIKLWAIALGCLALGLGGVLHLYAYIAWHPAPAAPPLELGFLPFAVRLLPEVRRVNGHVVTVDDNTLTIIHRDGQHSCATALVRALEIKSEFDLAPSRGDPWRLRALDELGKPILEIRAAQLFGGVAVREIAAYLHVPLEVQVPLTV